MLSLEDLTYSYPRTRGTKFILQDISFSIEPGQIFTLLGPNGAGKTTIIRILSGSILPHGGTIVINGHDIRCEEQKARRSIGLVIGEERTFYYRLSGYQNLEFFGGLYGLHRTFLRNRIDELLTLVNLQKYRKLQYMRYSTGMKKRLNLARALLHDPPVLLLDEPNSGVDPESAQKLRNLIFQLKEQGRTILLTTHDMDEAEKMSDILAFLREGSLIRVGPLREFKEIIERRTLLVEFDQMEPIPETTAALLESDLKLVPHYKSITFSDGGMTIDFNENLDINGVVSTIIGHGIRIKNVKHVEPSLEEVFIKLAR